ncbi:MFS transporter [Streptomyces atriruber]|uniref:MFS transporter n=1 Tax=Streptomyces atriruber TaxID=545121 RepID=A0ABV3C0E7_9ACTN
MRLLPDADQALTRDQALPRTVWWLIGARAVNRLGAFSLSFLTVLITTQYGASTATAGSISAAFGLATVPSRLVGGQLADRLGRRRTIVVGLVGCAVAQFGIVMASSLAMTVVFVVLLGLVFELYEPPSQAMIADAVGPTERTRAYSLLNAALAAAGMGAGLLAAGLGRWDLRQLFVVDAVACLLCALVVRNALPGDPPRAVQTAAEAGSGRGSGSGSKVEAQTVPVAVAPWRDSTLLALLAAGTLFALVYLQIMATLPLVLAHRGLPPADAGVLFTASALTIVLGQPLLRLKPLATLSTPVAFGVGYTLLAAGLAGYSAAHTLGAHLAPTIVWSLGDLILVGRAYALVAALAPAHGTGRYLAVYGTSWGIAGIAAPLIGTQLLQRWGPTALWLTMSAACLALAITQPRLARTATARASQTAEPSAPAPAPAPAPKASSG